LVLLVTVAFFGLATSATSMLLTPGGQALTRGEPSVWMVVPVLAGLAVLLLLGLHPPGELTGLIARGVTELRGTP
jgi:hydrogenase-4 component F